MPRNRTRWNSCPHTGRSHHFRDSSILVDTNTKERTGEEKFPPQIESVSEESNDGKVPSSIWEKIVESDGRLDPSELFLLNVESVIEIGRTILDAYAPQQEYFGETEDELTNVN